MVKIIQTKSKLKFLFYPSCTPRTKLPKKINMNFKIQPPSSPPPFQTTYVSFLNNTLWIINSHQFQQKKYLPACRQRIPPFLAWKIIFLVTDLSFLESIMPRNNSSQPRRIFTDTTFFSGETRHFDFRVHFFPFINPPLRRSRGISYLVRIQAGKK